MRKEEGSILIEVMVSIFILSIACVFAVSTTSKCIKEYKIRTDKEEINRAINMIIKEIKYNTEQDKLDEMFNGSSEISFKYEFQLSKNAYTLDYYHFLSQKIRLPVSPSFHFPLFLSKKRHLFEKFQISEGIRYIGSFFP